MCKCWHVHLERFVFFWVCCVHGPASGLAPQVTSSRGRLFLAPPLFCPLVGEVDVGNLALTIEPLARAHPFHLCMLVVPVQNAFMILWPVPRPACEYAKWRLGPHAEDSETLQAFRVFAWRAVRFESYRGDRAFLTKLGGRSFVPEKIHVQQFAGDCTQPKHFQNLQEKQQP